jgi:F-type H+-transporting ATPase subunit delta
MASIALRYARAFADVVIDLKLDPQQVRQELDALVGLVHASPDLRKVWDSPKVHHDEKIRLLTAIAERGGFETSVRNFMAVLIDHGRASALPAIAREFNRELNQRLGFVDAGITSTRELLPEERSALELQVAKLTGRKVRASYQTDKKLLGGAVVRVGSTIYDGSLRGQLQRIRQQLSGD